MNDMKYRFLEDPRKSVSKKLFILIFFSIVILVVAMGTFTYQISKNIIEDKVAKGTLQTILQASDKMDGILNNYEELTLQMMTDKALFDAFSRWNDPHTSKLDAESFHSLIEQKLNSYLTSKDGFVAIHLYSLPSHKVFSVGTSPISVDFSQEGWFKQTLNAPGQVVWLDTRKKGYAGNNLFGMSRMVKFSNEDSVILFEIKVDRLTKALKNIDVGNSGQILMLNSANRIIQSSEFDAIEQDSPVKLNNPSQNGIVYDEVNRQKRLVVYNKLNISQWYVVESVLLSEVTKETKKIYTIILIMVMLALFLALLLSYFVVRMVGQPIGKLCSLMQEGEQGNLSIQADFKSKDEIGRLGQSFNQMMKQISFTVLQASNSAKEVASSALTLSDVSQKIAASAGEIAFTSEEIAVGSTNLAMKSEEVANLSHQNAIQTKNAVELNNQMSLLALEIQNSSELGTQHMSELMEKANFTERSTYSMVNKVNNLKESTLSIRKILYILTNMTKQTNILSLNASIEAARAGSAGKGFKVVADEIRKLVEQSNQSFDVVKNITETIEKEIDETVVIISESYPVFKEQIISVKETDLILNKVKEHTKNFIRQLNGVKKSIQILDQSQSEVADNMMNVNAAAQQFSAASQEITSLNTKQLSVSELLVTLSENLEKLSNSFEGALGKFKLNEE
ncbi:MAG: methyl-accepting chemotaxis protein [Paenibacillaceae bacterium]